MKTKLLIWVCMATLLASCGYSTVEKNCISVVQKRYGKQPGFKILKTRVDDAEEVKLALGKYESETRTVVSVNFASDSSKKQSCTCLMGADGGFIVTTDEIKY